MFHPYRYRYQRAYDHPIKPLLTRCDIVLRANQPTNSWHNDTMAYRYDIANEIKQCCEIAQLNHDDPLVLKRLVRFAHHHELDAFEPDLQPELALIDLDDPNWESEVRKILAKRYWFGA